MKAGVSTGTVDRVLHNRGKVAPEVKERVLKVVEELGYERNLLASTLAYNRTTRVAVMLPNTEKDMYWRQTQDGVERAQKAVQHYGLVVEPFFFDYFDPQSFLQTAQTILDQKPDGLLFPPIFFQEAQWLLAQCSANGIPKVIVNTNIADSDALCYIGQDSYQSGVLGARLLSFGANSGQSVCLLNLEIGTQAAQHLLEKERGFRDYFAHNNGNKKIDIIRKDFEGFNDPIQLKAFIHQLIADDSRLCGIFVTNSRVHKIIDCLEGFHSKLKIAGFDLIPTNLEYLQANKINFLINQNPSEQGFLGVMSLFRHLILKQAVEKTQFLPLDIVVKENAEYYLKKQAAFELIG